MPEPTSYQLLKDIHKVTQDLDKKWDKRMTSIENKQDATETKIDTIAGKAAVGVIILSATIGTSISLIASWVKDKIMIG